MKKEDKNFEIFEEMLEIILKDKRYKTWEPWKLAPNANFFMTLNTRDHRFPPTKKGKQMLENWRDYTKGDNNG